jgi:hypothetical protein
MGFSYFNPNPAGLKVGDCTVRAIAKATGKSWDEIYIGLCLQGLILGDLPSANSVWGAYLRQHGFTRNVIPDTCPDCYTVDRFSDDVFHMYPFRGSGYSSLSFFAKTRLNASRSSSPPNAAAVNVSTAERSISS